MNRKDIWPAIELEIRGSKGSHPNWPDHVVAQAGIVSGAAGLLMEGALQCKYGKLDEGQLAEHREMMKEAAIYTAVVAIRFLENLK